MTEKIHRLLRLIMLLHAGQAGSPDELAKMLAVTRRTLFRDLAALKKAGVPHHFEPGAGYRIGKADFLPPINLNVVETLGLLVLGKTATAMRDRPMMVHALSAINKMILTIPQPLRVACGDMMSHVSVNPGGRSHSDREGRHYTTIQKCIDEGRSCAMRYMSPTQPEAMTMRLDPCALHFGARAWYVFGKTDQHPKVRIFKLSRIEQLDEMPRLFKKPVRFSAEKHLGKAWAMIPEGKVQRIELEFSPKVAMNVAEVRWHPTQQTRRLDDGRCVITFDVDGLNEISWWVCGYADHVKVRKPRELAEMVRGMHERAVKV